MKTKYNVLTLIMLLFLSACSATNPVRVAETLEQKAFAMYGVFVVVEEAAADLIESPDVPVNVKLNIQQIDAKAKPLADNVLRGVLQVSDMRQQLAAGTGSEEKLAVLNANLEQWLTEATPVINSFLVLVNNE